MLMQLHERIEAFAELGNFFSLFSQYPSDKCNPAINNNYYDTFNNLIIQAKHHNPWFTEDNIRHALSVWTKNLTVKNLKKWAGRYPELSAQKKEIKTVGVVTAGNVPLVGFHDMLCVLLSGNRFMAKLSSKDAELLKTTGEILKSICPDFNNLIIFEKEKLQNFDYIIATGSNNTARYFEYYFGKYPHIIRKNRNGIAILTGKENDKELKKLGDDIFLYFGLGCRNISKMYVPENYDFNMFFGAIEHYKDMINNNKYANNYNYNQAIFLLEQIKHLDNGFLLLKQDKAISSPASVLHYEHYKNMTEIKNTINDNSSLIQCIVAKDNSSITNSIPFGKTQEPELWDYADNIDTIDFLINNQ